METLLCIAALARAVRDNDTIKTLRLLDELETRLEPEDLIAVLTGLLGEPVELPPALPPARLVLCA